MTKAMIGTNTQIVYVGDENQAIFAFCGADNKSFDKIVDFCDGNVLPLSTCYRCDASIVEWAQDYRPDIKAREGANNGHVDYVKSVSRIDFDDWLFDDSITRLLITRNNKPLTDAFLALYRSGIKFKMSDRKITSIVEDGLRVYNVYAEDAGLTKVMNPKQWCNLNSRTIGAVISEIDYQLGNAKEPHEIETLKAHSEELHGFSLLFGLFGAHTDDQSHMIDKMRKALIDPNSTLLLSTAHGSKGLEADSVIVLGWDKFVTMEPTEWQLKRFTPEEIEQEQHLSYVAGTRAKKELCFSISSEVEYCYGDNIEVAA
jgi:superfamily I DNA/RNA helicase